MSRADREPPRLVRRLGLELGVLAVVLLGLALSGVAYIRSSQTGSVDSEYVIKSMALQVAALSLQDGQRWLEAQRRQPVRRFDPGSGQGLRRSHDLGAGLQARSWLLPATGDPQASLDLFGLDITRRAGRAWRLCSQVEIHSPAEQATQLSLRAEQDFYRLQLHLPVAAALYVRDAQRFALEPGAVLSGTGVAAGLAYPGSAQAEPRILGKVDGEPRIATLPGAADRLEDVFGVSAAVLQRLAHGVHQGRQTLPARLASDQLHLVTGNLRLGPGSGLQGGGVLVVLGDLEMGPGHASTFAGLIYVRGNLSIAAPCQLRGAILCTGAARLRGDGDPAHLAFDRQVLSGLRRYLGRYHPAGPARVLPHTPTK